MVSHMEKNISLARGFHKGGIAPLAFKKKWNDLAPQLNSLGPPLRDGDGWQKVWNDFKFKVKKKIIHNKNETGGGSKKQYILSSLEESVSSILCFDPIGIVQGISAVNATGPPSSPTPAPSTSYCDEITFSEPVTLDLDSTFVEPGILDNNIILETNINSEIENRINQRKARVTNSPQKGRIHHRRTIQNKTKNIKITRNVVMDKLIKIIDTPIDSAQIFGDFVADKLRHFSTPRRKRLENDIQRLLITACEEENS